MVLIVTSDNEHFHADKDVVERSVLIKNMLEGLHRFRLSLFHQQLLTPIKMQMSVNQTNPFHCQTYLRAC
jgi:hypothetical protein